MKVTICTAKSAMDIEVLYESYDRVAFLSGLWVSTATLGGTERWLRHEGTLYSKDDLRTCDVAMELVEVIRATRGLDNVTKLITDVGGKLFAQSRLQAEAFISGVLSKKKVTL